MTDYVQKEKDLLSKLQETGYEGFDDKDQAMDFVSMSFESFPNYADSVIKRNIMQPILKDRYDGEPKLYQDNMQSLHDRCENSYNVAVQSIDRLNDLSEKHGLGKFTEADTKNRKTVEEFIGDYVTQSYQDGISQEPQKTREVEPKPYVRSAIETDVAEKDSSAEFEMD